MNPTPCICQGGAASIPEASLDAATAAAWAGDRYDGAVFDLLKDAEGRVPREALVAHLQALENAEASDAIVTSEDAAVSEDAAASELFPPTASLVTNPALDEQLRVACGKVNKQVGKLSEGAVVRLLAQGADPSAADEDGWTALFYAAGDGRVEATRALLAAAAGTSARSVDWQDPDGCTALWVAAYNNQRQPAVVLLSCGADLDLKGVDSSGRVTTHATIPQGQKWRKRRVLTRAPSTFAAAFVRAWQAKDAVPAAMAARRNNNPGLADLLDSEGRLRARDPERRLQLLSGEMAEADFVHTLKVEETTPYTERDGEYAYIRG